jgi:hypothetical protein
MPFAGVSYVLLGQRSGISSMPHRVLSGSNANDYFGALTQPGDFNGDASLDAVVAAPATPVGGATGAGAVFVLRGASGALEPAPFRAYFGRNANDRFETAIGRSF